MEEDKLTDADLAFFTYMFGQKFFLETSKGNFVWSDPEYGGDNTIVPYNGTLRDYCENVGPEYGRSKGLHFIFRYCPNAVIKDK